LTAREKWTEIGKEIEAEISRMAEKKFRDAVQCRDTRRVWEQLKPKNAPPDVAGVSLTNWVKHFSNINFKGEPPLKIPPTSIKDESLDDEITEEEVLKAVNGKKDRKAAGSDGIPNEVWKEFCKDPEALALLVTALNDALTNAEIPEQWRMTKLFLLYKGKGSPADPNSYRGIALTQTILKVFETVLANRISRWAEANCVLPSSQAGFRAGFSTADHVFLYDRLMAKYRNGGKKMLIAQIDLQKAFPSVPRQRLLNKLAGLGMSSKMISTLWAIYKEDRFVVITSEGKSEEFPVDTGLKEGSCLSPLLFILFISDLPYFLKQNGVNVEVPKIGGPDQEEEVWCLTYADDTVVFALTAEGMHRQLESVVLFCKANGLTVNGKKTEIMEIGPRNRESWLVDGTTIVPQTKVDYLGFTFTRTGSYWPQVEKVRKRSLSRIFLAISAIRKCRMVNTRIAKQVFSALVKSTLSYGLLVMVGNVSATRLNASMWNFYKQLLDLPAGFRSEFLARTLGEACMQCVAGMEAVRYIIRLHKQDGPRLALLAVKEMLVERECFNGTNKPDNWLGRLLGFLETSLDKHFNDAAEFQNWAKNARIKDVNYHVTVACHKKCFDKNGEADLGSPDYSCFMALLPTYIGVHHLVSNTTENTRKALLVLTGAWKWTRQFGKWKNLASTCRACPGEVETDLTHVVWGCISTRAALARYEDVTNVPTTVETIMAAMTQEEETAKLITLASEIFDLLLAAYECTQNDQNRAIP
jgi:hypothetical protein